MRKPTSAQLFQLWRVSQGKIPRGKSVRVLKRNEWIEFIDVPLGDGLIGGEYRLTLQGRAVLTLSGEPS